jgi:hypothetical protein
MSIGIDKLEELMELQDDAALAMMKYKESLDPTSNVVSIAPGSPARHMWETRMALIKFVWENSESEE